ncbi:MAG: hypothetical protein HY644_03790 [Acidobacteria bacterium]|nr:hypothetical protein [Acidobacteriota bacterium]
MEIRAFAFKDCALTVIATARRAQNLREFKDILETIGQASIYYHFWGHLLRPGFDDPEYNNDFASWAHRGLHDSRLAESLSIIDPSDFTNLETLRHELIRVVEERLDETEMVPWVKADQQFHFLRSQIVVFDTGKRITEPEGLALILPHASVGSTFFHFIDARRRSPEHMDDFRTWLGEFGDECAQLREQLAAVDPYFLTLTELRSQLTLLFANYFGAKVS